MVYERGNSKVESRTRYLRNSQSHMKLLLFTGLSASGKSTISSFLSEKRGIPRLDMHKIIHEIASDNRFERGRDWISNIGEERALKMINIEILKRTRQFEKEGCKHLIIDEVIDIDMTDRLSEFGSTNIIHIRANRNDRRHFMQKRLRTTNKEEARKEIKYIDVKKEKISNEESILQELSTQIKSSIDVRSEALSQLKDKFNDLDQFSETIQFGVEIDFSPEAQEKLSSRFNRKETSDYIEDSGILKIEIIREKPLEFMEAVYSAKQKVLSGQDRYECLVDVLTFVEEIRFKATMENDTIGGFSTSSMTEGKQALFALTLLLNKESDTWPLLIDQPEDDLDSRSIYGQIVPYLKEQKKRRQIIMVSHNANLVIGADSEQVIVANQHGDDRKNTNNQKFNYFSGSLEFTRTTDPGEEIILQSCGIREHSCDILDGGKAAFEKRKHKYNL